MKISISGTPASGKSSIAKKLAEELGYKYYSMGDLQRQIANEKNITIQELSKLESEDKSIDQQIDNKQRKLGKEKDNFIIDSRLAPHFIPDAVKIFVDADPNIRAERRVGQKRNEENFESTQDAFELMQKRQESDRDRFINFYGFDFLDMSNYELVVDTTGLTIDDACEKIKQFVKNFN
ncbi:MAG: (d)CMP kinase [Nanobdellota archaeon]